MRYLVCLLTLSFVCCASEQVVTEEPLIVPKSVPLTAGQRARNERERVAQPRKEPTDKAVVMPLKAAALEAGVSGSLDRRLVSRLDERKEYEIITPDDIGSLLGVERLRDAMGCNDVSCAADFAGALDARYVLYGVIDELGGRLTVTLNLVDARHQRVAARGQVSTDRDESLYYRAIDAAVARLLGDTEAPTDIVREKVRRDGFGTQEDSSRAVSIEVDPAWVGPIFVDIPETLTIRQSNGAETAEHSSRDAEVTIVGSWRAHGFDPLARVVVGEASLDKLAKLGVVYWLVGEAAVRDSGTMMGTNMHSILARVAVQVIDVASGKIVASAKNETHVGHIDVEAGATRALDKAASECSSALLLSLVKNLQMSEP